MQGLSDGSYLTRLSDKAECQRNRRRLAAGVDTETEGVLVRVVVYEIINRNSDQTGPIRWIATMLDPEHVSAGELAAACHCRWEFETSLAELETSQRGSYWVLRSHSPAMVR
ncbi:hypothetical protein [Nocardia sp. NPDC004123]